MALSSPSAFFYASPIRSRLFGRIPPSGFIISMYPFNKLSFFLACLTAVLTFNLPGCCIGFSIKIEYFEDT